MASWRKSSYSDSDKLGSCIEVATGDRTVFIRDSKHPTRSHLTCTPTQFRTLLTGLKHA